MLNKRILRSKKAISPILATLLLIVIAVAAIVVTYAWIMTYMSNAGQQAGVMLKKANVSFYPGGKIGIDVQNTGTSNTQLIKVYAGTSSGNRVEQTASPETPFPRQLNAGSIATINFTYDFTVGNTYYFRVLSSSGQELDLTEIATS